MLKRVRRELEIWPDDQCDTEYDDRSSVLRVARHDVISILHVPPNYPFAAPRHHSALCKGTPHLDVQTWTLAVLSFPPSRSVIRTPYVECVCCESVTCKWSVPRRLYEAAYEALFSGLYKRLADVRSPYHLPDELWIRIAELS